MKAVQLKKPGGLDNLYVSTLVEPGAPRPDEIKVRLRASSLNFHDYLIATGKMPSDDGRILMSDGAGEVVAVGSAVTEFTVGDAVVSTFFTNWVDGDPADNGFASVPGDGLDGYSRELVVTKASCFTHAPTGYSHKEAATLTCAGVTAWRALVVNGNVKAGDVVLVQGTGGVSIFALQFAKACGATVIATSSSDEKLERLKSFGADHLINYRTTENWGAAAKALTGGRGVDHVVEVGGVGNLPQSITACRRGGHIAVIGVLTGLSGNVPVAQILMSELRIIGLAVGSRRHQLDMIRAIEANGIKPVLDKSFPLEKLADAFRYQETGKHFGKICIDI
ncbi:MAG: NAD(P)-dependent alcohol dehydrogenase [Proteobacteria bacterium]|nr:NAD(P)-dependent alcohol dehydrogenase [Pseudomonadota bacterium]